VCLVVCEETTHSDSQEMRLLAPCDPAFCSFLLKFGGWIVPLIWTELEKTFRVGVYLHLIEALGISLSVDMGNGGLFR
jgi:hypothetical protein